MRLVSASSVTVGTLRKALDDELANVPDDAILVYPEELSSARRIRVTEMFYFVREKCNRPTECCLLIK